MTAQGARDWDAVEQARRDQAAKAPGVPRDVGACAGPRCGSSIRWAITADGARMPVDMDPDPDGNLIRVMVARGDWRIRVLAAGEIPPPGTHRWVSHYATCPDAAWFRSRGKTAPAAQTAPAKASAEPVLAAPPVLLVVDGNSVFHRAWHGYQRTGMTTPDGRPCHAVYGFLRLLAGIVSRVHPDGLLVGFDDPATSARRDRYPGYKAGRDAKHPDLVAQLADVVAVLGELGVATVTPPGLEADDVTASAAARAQADGWRCVIATSDKDSFAQIGDGVTVLRLVSGIDNAEEITPAKLSGQYGVAPGQWLDYAALVGDKSDNLAGVDGIGPKTAARLLAACGSLEAAFADPGAAVAAVGKAAAKLADPGSREVIDRNRNMMAAVTDVPVDLERCRHVAPAGTVAAVLRARHLPGLIDRITAALCGRAGTGGRQQRTADTATTAVSARLVWQRPSPVCPGCARPTAATVPLFAADGSGGLADTGDRVLVERAHPLGDLVPVAGGARRADHAERGRVGARWQSHTCPRYTHRCVCGRPARLYPGGALCDQHAPQAVWCCAPAHAKLLPTLDTKHGTKK